MRNSFFLILFIMIHMKKIKNLFFIACLLMALSCKKDNPIVTPPDNTTTTKDTTLITPPLGWTKNTTLSLGFPKTAAFYETTTPFRAFACVFDLNDTTLSLRTAVNTARKVPSEWLASLGSNVLMLANGGYFDLTNGASYSLVVDNSKSLSYNVKALTRTFNGAAATYYPTRGAFGITGRTPSVGWVYNSSGADNYIYPTPSPNALNTAPQAVPSPTFPVGGAVWSPTVAIGGSPVLLYKSNINITDAAELIDINNTTGRSRTAIGFTAKNRVVIMTIELNASLGTKGASLAQTAQLMKDWGCTDAVNLDGGGSTCMLAANNQVTNTPEAGSQRAVTSVVYLVKK
jgi:hypothetical protein